MTNPARSQAARDSWDDPFAHAMRCAALRQAWVERRRRSKPVTAAWLRKWNTFACLTCGAECVGTEAGPRLCSNCRAERIA